MDFGKMSGEDVEATLLRLRAGERRLEVQVLRGLIELDRRKLYLDWGYASLFAYCVERLGYCESSAGRRIAAARAMRRIPRIEGMLLSGEARLSTVAMAAGELERDEGVLEEILGRGHVPRKQDRVRAVSEVTWEFRFSAGPALREKFERAKALLPKKHPEGVAFEQVLEAALDKYLKRHDPGAAAGSETPHSPEGASGRRSNRPTPPGGVIVVRARSRRMYGGRYRAGTGAGVRIGALEGVDADVEVDHVKAFCRGGPHREENLRLLCSAHNRREAERSLGRRWMRQFYCLRE